MRLLWTCCSLLLILQPSHAQNSVEQSVSSPDGNIEVRVHIARQLAYSVSFKGQPLMDHSAIGLTLDDGSRFGPEPRMRRHRLQTVDQWIEPLYGKRSRIPDRYNELTLTFRGGYGVTFRVYDEGFGFRMSTDLKDSVYIRDERAEFNFAADYHMWAMHPTGGTFEHSYENFYTYRKLSALSDTIIALPALVNADNNVKLLITEAALEEYPGFHLKRSTQGNGLQAVFPAYPLEVCPGGYNRFNLVVQERADYIAKTAGTRHFPWRVIKISGRDEDLLDTDLVYKFSEPAASDLDFSWVKPGKVAWDWWNALNMTGVDFRTGVNTESYLYFIDFAAENGLEYINLDEGWSNQYDLTDLSDDIDLRKIVEYAHSKSVGIFLWCVHWPLDEKMEEAMAMFEGMGIRGLKIDFMDRDDQVMVNYYHRVAQAAAKHRLLVNFHGAYKPAGLHRKYPNVINREAVRGLEYNKFSKPHGTTPEYAVTIPFIRMAAGPMDYTPGAMTNAQKANFGVFFERPMSQGTRCQQLAMYVLYEAPLQMLSDAPTAYQKEPEILHFIAGMPTTWDETVALQGKVGDYAVVARRKGDTWYVAGMTDWTPRTLHLDFSFLEEGNYRAVIFHDGINADRNGNDYKRTTTELRADAGRQMQLAPGGGFVIRLVRE